jgi:putative endopeptidase
MKSLWLCAATAALLVGAAHAEDLAKSPTYGTWGLDLTAGDPSVKPGDDFYQYAEGRAIAAMTIPADRTRYGSFIKLADLSDARGRQVIEDAAADRKATGNEAKIGAFYRSFMDEAAVDRLGAAPMRQDLDAIRHASSREDIARLMGLVNVGFQSAIFAPDIETDQKAPTRYAVYLNQAGLGLPDRDYYLKPEFAEQKAKYEAYVAQMLRMIGWPDPEADAKAIVAMETRIAEASWTRAERRDDDKTYNPTTPAELEKAAPGFPWAPFLKAAELGGVQRLVVRENTAFPKIAEVFAQTPVPVLKAWMAFGLVDNAAPYLSKPFVDAHFEFRAKTLAGQQEQRPRWKRGVTLVGDQMGFAVGKLYVDKYFPPESKAKMEQLVSDLRVALKGRIERLDWMSPQTKARALEKLAKFHVKIGYPDKWRDYSALRVSDEDLYGNIERAVGFEWNRELKRLYKPVDKSEWFMTPQTVNAYYSQTENEIVFPAAILQPPFFDPNADPAVNFGGIGAVIGHEMTHGFDDEGRKSDGDGMLRDWWTAADSKKFDERAKRLGEEYGAVEVYPGAHIKPELTMGENIADLGGVLVALDAYHASLGGKPAAVIDGLTGDQRFFLSFAQIWRSKSREAAMRQRLVSDPHSPEPDRVDIPLRNVDAWYAAFDVKPGEKMYLPPDQRARIW